MSEIGCAYALSSLHVLGALANRAGAFHTIVDPGQRTEWKGIGIAQLERCRVTNYRLIEDFSEFVLPDLVRQGERFDFILIDGWHTFDHVLLDFFCANRLLSEGGVVLLDDLQLPGIRKVARYIANLPNYRVAGTARQSVFPPSAKREAMNKLLRTAAHALPASFSETTFDAALFTPDYELGLTSEMVAFQKTGPDQRDSHWFEPF